MDVFEAVRTLLAVRTYQDRPVPSAIVHEIVEAGHLTASAMNKQPWHFVVVDDEAMLAEIGSKAKTGPYIAGAAFAIVVAREAGSPLSVSDASRAIQSMMLTAWSHGVGSNWVGFGGLDEIQVLVGIPENYDVLGVVPFGYPNQPTGKGEKRRKPIGEVVSYGRFGEPWS
jgi:nitroreductase